jgi:hypothetical protein
MQALEAGHLIALLVIVIICWLTLRVWRNHVPPAAGGTVREYNLTPMSTYQDVYGPLAEVKSVAEYKRWLSITVAHYMVAFPTLSSDEATERVRRNAMRQSSRFPEPAREQIVNLIRTEEALATMTGEYQAGLVQADREYREQLAEAKRDYRDELVRLSRQEELRLREENEERGDSEV